MKNKSKIIILIIIIFIIGLIGCKNKTDTIIQKKVENISQVKFSDLQKYKNSYVGDNSAVGNILYNLPGNMYDNGFSLKTDKQPYGIVVNYNVNTSLGKEDYNNFWNVKEPKEFLQDNALILFSLIKNVDIISFNVDNVGIYEYNRKDLEIKFGKDLKSIVEDESSFKEFFKAH